LASLLFSDSDVSGVGVQQDINGRWHTLTEHWDGAAWSVVNAVDAGSQWKSVLAVKALASNV